MTFHESAMILPDPDDFHVRDVMITRKRTPAGDRTLRIYYASIFRRIERRRQRERDAQEDATS